MVSAKHIKLSLKVSQANRGNIFHSNRCTPENVGAGQLKHK